MKKMVSTLAVLTVLAATHATTANAAVRDTGYFKPAGPYVSSGNNFYFRVSGIPASANCVQNWAYINEDDSGAKAKIATMLMAYSMGKTVSLMVDEGLGGYCRILELVVG